MSERRARIGLTAILLLALTLRLYWVLIADPRPSLEGGDGPYYLSLGWAIALPASTEDLLNLGLMATGPVYPLYLSAFFADPPDFVRYGARRYIDFDRSMQMPHVLSAAQTARVGQAMVDVLTCLLIFHSGRRLFGARTGLLAALAFAVDLRFVTQTGAINTETLFIFLLVSGVWAFVVARSATRWQVIGYAAAAILLLLAAFTRAVALPLIALFALLPLLPRPARPQLIGAALIVGVGLLMVGAWVVRNYQATGQVVIISDGFGSNFWMGSRLDGQWHGIIEFDKERADLQSRYGGRDAYVEDALRTIAADPTAYARLLFVKVTRAYLQPYGTVVYPGESLKELAAQVLRGERSLAELVKGEAFWPKLIVYIFHYTGLIGGLIGLWLARRDWLKVLPLLLPILYFTVAYTLLTIIPRYIFPIMPFYMILAAYAGATIFSKVTAERNSRQTANVE